MYAVKNIRTTVSSSSHSLKADHKVISIDYKTDISFESGHNTFLIPPYKYVVHIDVCQYRRTYWTLYQYPHNPPCGDRNTCAIQTWWQNCNWRTSPSAPVHLARSSMGPAILPPNSRLPCGDIGMWLQRFFSFLLKTSRPGYPLSPAVRQLHIFLCR